MMQLVVLSDFCKEREAGSAPDEAVVNIRKTYFIFHPAAFRPQYSSLMVPPV